MPEILLWLLASALAYLAVAWLYPPSIRLSCWTLVHALYSYRVYGRDRIPKAGPVLIVCNHVSYFDWLVVGVACPRSAAFVIWAGYYRNPVLRVLLSWARTQTIRIDSRAARPRDVVESLRAVAAALDAGRVVILFPEGRNTRSGNMRPFGRGVEQILKRTTVPVTVVPTCTDGLWGSTLSHRGGRIGRKWPDTFRRRVAVMFGTPVKSAGQSVPTAPTLQLAVQETIADCAVAQSDGAPLVHRAFVRRAVRFRYLFKTCAIDTATGVERTLTWGKMFVGSVCVARYLRSRVGPEPHVGVWLPTSVGMPWQTSRSPSSARRR